MRVGGTVSHVGGDMTERARHIFYVLVSAALLAALCLDATR